MEFIIARLKEKTTYAGLAAIINAAGVALKPELWQEITTVCMGVAGIMLVIFNEKKGKK